MVKTHRSASSDAFKNSLYVSALISGQSPLTISVFPVSFFNSSAIITACPVPNCGSCKAYELRFPRYSRTSSPLYPITVTIRSIPASSRLSHTCPIIGSPRTFCMTLACSETMRVPLPAAKIIAFPIVYLAFLFYQNIAYMTELFRKFPQNLRFWCYHASLFPRCRKKRRDPPLLFPSIFFIPGSGIPP